MSGRSQENSAPRVFKGGWHEQGQDPIDVHFEVRCREVEEALSEEASSSDPRKTKDGYESEIRRQPEVVRIW